MIRVKKTDPDPPKKGKKRIKSLPKYISQKQDATNMAAPRARSVEYAENMKQMLDQTTKERFPKRGESLIKAKEWVMNMLSSPKHKERVKNAYETDGNYFKPEDNIINQMRKVEGDAPYKTDEWSQGSYSPWDNKIQLSAIPYRPTADQIAGTYAHELRHKAGGPFSTDKEKLGAILKKAKGDDTGFGTRYLFGQSEARSRMTELRMRLQEKGVYDPFTEDAPASKIKEIRKEAKGHADIEHLFKKLNDEEVLWLMDNMVMNEKETNNKQLA